MPSNARLKNTIGHWQIKNEALRWDKISDRFNSLESELAAEKAKSQKLFEALEYINKNCELIAYDLIGGDGAPSGHIPYPHDMGFISRALAEYNNTNDPDKLPNSSIPEWQR